VLPGLAWLALPIVLIFALRRGGFFRAWGIAACFSFYPGKNLGAYGDGGAVCTNDDALADQLAQLRDHGRAKGSKYAHDVIGYGERLDSLQAAILGAKLPHLQGWNDARRDHARAYDMLLPAGMTPVQAEAAHHVYHIYCVRVGENRDAIQAALKSGGVETGIHYPIPLHRQPPFAARCAALSLPVTERLAREVLSLPMYPRLTVALIEEVCVAIRAFLGRTSA